MIDKRKDFVCPHCGYWKHFQFYYSYRNEYNGVCGATQMSTNLMICRKCGTVYVPQKILREMNDNAED